MKNSTLRRLLLFMAITTGVAAMTAAQDAEADRRPPPDVQQLPPDQPPDRRGNLFRQLGLSLEQMQEIRKINMERRPVMEEAQRRSREAYRALDAAIYADEVSDAEVQARLKDVQAAQAELQRIRYMNELSIRRILTPEQLVRFRELRERFEEARRGMPDRRPFRRPMDGRMRNDERMPSGDARPPGRIEKQEPKPKQ